jgi:hypothetical protein
MKNDDELFVAKLAFFLNLLILLIRLAKLALKAL